MHAGISSARPVALQRFYRETRFTGLNAAQDGPLTEKEAEPTHPGRGGKGWPRYVGTDRGTFLPAGPAAGAAPARGAVPAAVATADKKDRKSTRLNSSHVAISYAVFCLKKKKTCSGYTRSP